MTQNRIDLPLWGKLIKMS